MKKTNVTVPWGDGLHSRPATRLVHLARRYRSTIHIKAQGRVADARSILSILLLCATVGSLLEVEVFGDDEHDAAAAIEQLFSGDSDADDAPLDISAGDEDLKE